MSPTEKGQVSMEFMAYFGILLLVFVVFGPIVVSQTAVIGERSRKIEVGRIATVLEREINNAIIFGDGYKRNFSIPYSLSDKDYEVSVDSTEKGKVLRVSSDGIIENRQLILTDIDGAPTPGHNTLKNEEGMIVFE